MTENMKKFAEQASQNTTLKAELEAFGKEYGDNGQPDKKQFEQNKAEINHKVAEIAAKYGFTLTEADFAAGKTELSEMELEAISGGGDDKGLCVCVIGGFGYGIGGRSDLSCACAVGGLGGPGHTDVSEGLCVCPVVGYGE